MRDPSAPVSNTNPEPANCNDDEIFDQMRKDGIQPAALSSDMEFLRLVSIDLTGQIPQPRHCGGLPG